MFDVVGVVCFEVVCGDWSVDVGFVVGFVFVVVFVVFCVND